VLGTPGWFGGGVKVEPVLDPTVPDVTPGLVSGGAIAGEVAVDPGGDDSVPGAMVPPAAPPAPVPDDPAVWANAIDVDRIKPSPTPASIFAFVMQSSRCCDDARQRMTLRSV
jgi:hypothetical protein